jgi:enoyl-CoA hydratase
MKATIFLLCLGLIFSVQTEFIKYEEETDIAILTINRPKALNALNSQVLDELDKVLESIDTEKIHALIITGAGEKSFVAGADIAEMSILTKAQGAEFSKKGNDVFRKIETFPIPVIAAINGFALGGGCEISMSCDIRICSDNAIFGQPEVGLGITPGFGGTQRLARLVGLGMAKQLIFTGQNIKAEEAYRIGLVNAVYPQQELLNEAKKLATTIAKNGANAIKNSKKAINDGYQMEINKAIQIEEQLFGECFQSDEQVIRMKNFLEKNKKKSAKKEEKPKNLRQEEKKETDAPKEKVGELISKEDQEFMDKALVPTGVFENMKLLQPFTTPKMPAVLSAGNKESHNSCVIGWGLLGVAWSKPLFIVYVKPDRYTYQFMEKTEFFTVNFIKKSLYPKFRAYGNKSGRDINKEEVTGAQIVFMENGGITFKEAEEVYVCKMMARTYLEKKNLSPEIVDFYEKAAPLFKQSTEPHGIYIGEIIGHYKK